MGWSRTRMPEATTQLATTKPGTNMENKSATPHSNLRHRHNTHQQQHGPSSNIQHSNSTKISTSYTPKRASRELTATSTNLIPKNSHRPTGIADDKCHQLQVQFLPRSTKAFYRDVIPLQTTPYQVYGHHRLPLPQHHFRVLDCSSNLFFLLLVFGLPTTILGM